MVNGAQGKDSARPARSIVPADSVVALAHTEGTIAQRIITSSSQHVRSVPPRNAFGESAIVEVIDDPAELVRRAAACAAVAERTAIVATVEELTRARLELHDLAAQRLPVVAHVLAPRGLAHAFSLADLGWGMLFSCGAEEASDFSLVARRAAEDSGTPFFVVHERDAHVETLTELDPAACEAFVGAPGARLRRASDPAHPAHADISSRAFAERVPFALGSALRELEAITGRRHDTIERFPAPGVDRPAPAGSPGGAHVAFLGVGRVGDSLLSAVERLRAAGNDVSAVRITALRPFGGPRLVKALSRAVAITVLESVDEPLAQSNPITRELKAAFSDALTWAPDYPGVGRMPRIVSGVVNMGDHELEASDLDAVLQNMLADERGKRSFVLGASASHSIPPAAGAASQSASRELSVRGRVRDPDTARLCAELFTQVLAFTLGTRVRASARAVQAIEGEGYAFDVLASRERPRGTHAPHAVRVVALAEAASLLRGNPIARLAEGGSLAVPTIAKSGEALWAELPPYTKAIVHDRQARVFGFAPPEGPPALVAAAFVGVVLALVVADAKERDGASSLDGAHVARDVGAALHARGVPADLTARAAEVARAAFESRVEVPRATVERDLDAIALGRRDSRAAPR